MNDQFNETKALLSSINEEEKSDWQKDIIRRTISSLLEIEKKSIYGALRGKKKQMADILSHELKNYKDHKNASK